MKSYFGGVQMVERKISFYSDGYKLDGSLYLPDDYKDGEKRPCIIANSGYLGLNAIYPALFSRHLTKLGYVCLGFDYRGFAKSGGKAGYCRLEYEVEDIVNAVTYARMQDEIDINKIGLIGWGMGAAIVVEVASKDERVSCVAALNGFYNGTRWMKMVNTYADWLKMNKLMEEDKIRRVVTGESKYGDPYTFYPLDPETDDVVKENLNPVEGFGPEIAYVLGESIANFNAEKSVANISPRPIFIAHGKYNVLHPVEEVYSVFRKAKQPKHLFLLEGKHNDFMFDGHQVFHELIKKLDIFFKESLR